MWAVSEGFRGGGEGGGQQLVLLCVIVYSPTNVKVLMFTLALDMDTSSLTVTQILTPTPNGEPKPNAQPNNPHPYSRI